MDSDRRNFHADNVNRGLKDAREVLWGVLHDLEELDGGLTGVEKQVVQQAKAALESIHAKVCDHTKRFQKAFGFIIE